jgi:hypothetical protein
MQCKQLRQNRLRSLFRAEGEESYNDGWWSIEIAILPNVIAGPQ